MIPSARELADANGISVRQVAETVGESISGVCCGDEIRAMRVDGRSEIWVTTAFLTSGDAVRRISRHLRIPTDVAAALRGAALTGRFPSDRDDAADRTVCRRVLDMHRATSVARQSGFKFQLDGRRWMDGRSWVFSLYVECPDGGGKVLVADLVGPTANDNLRAAIVRSTIYVSDATNRRPEWWARAFNLAFAGRDIPGRGEPGGSKNRHFEDAVEARRKVSDAVARRCRRQTYSTIFVVGLVGWLVWLALA